ncbi:MAG: class I SAM-dependent methyltransferase [Dehalococcoidia bacterium]|nr:class I SAM-dependent methyltransferase [Dehalococcoidia bacterium]
MKPLGLALIDYRRGSKSASITIIRDDGLEVDVPVSSFFRGPEDLTVLERMALDRCRDHVLDVGAGSGHHSLVLQKRGLPVCAIDISAEAVQVMRDAGVADAREVNVFQLVGSRFDTIIMLGHGIGMAEDINGLRRLLKHLAALLRPEGQLLADSVDPRATGEPQHLAYHEANRKAGRYPGETRLRLRFKGQTGPEYGWLLIDPETLAAEASALGWTTEVIHQEADGNYLARLIRAKAVSRGSILPHKQPHRT